MVERIYLQPERPRISDLLRAVETECRQRGLKAPTFHTLQARLRELDQDDLVRRRFGAVAARQRFGPVGCSSLQPTSPLEVVQIDHTLVDVVVVDELERLPLGPPWLTLAIDVTSRMVIGFYVSLERPSTLSVALALSHAALPKDLWLSDRELDLEWLSCGLPESLHLDNAQEFKSEASERGTGEYGIKLIYRPPGRPHFGGHIERLIGTVMGAVHLLPGTTFASVTKKGSYRPEKTASLTLLELERWLALQIAGVYHHTVHSALHQTPANAWQHGLAQRPRPARQPQDRERFFLDFLPVATGMGKTRIIQRFLRENDSHFDEVRGTTRLPVVALQMPPTPHERDFYEELLVTMEAVLPVGLSSTNLRQRVRILARQLEVRMLVIDEIHAMLSGTFREQRIFLNCLRFLANDLHLPLVCVGTNEAKQALMTDQQLADRFEARELAAWRDDTAFHQLLASFGSTLPLRRASALREAGERIELETLNEEVVTASLVSISDRRTRRTAA